MATKKPVKKKTASKHPLAGMSEGKKIIESAKANQATIRIKDGTSTVAKEKARKLRAEERKKLALKQKRTISRVSKRDQQSVK